MCSAVGAVAVALLLLAGIDGSAARMADALPRRRRSRCCSSRSSGAGSRRRSGSTSTRETVESGGRLAPRQLLRAVAGAVPADARPRRTDPPLAVAAAVRCDVVVLLLRRARSRDELQTTLYVIFIVAYGFGTLGYWVCGHAHGSRTDAVRRRSATGSSRRSRSIALFQVRGPAALGALLVVAVFFGLGMAPVTGAISTELFPTYIRNQSAAWAATSSRSPGSSSAPCSSACSATTTPARSARSATP